MDSDSKKVMYNRDDLISVTNGANKYEFVVSIASVNYYMYILYEI